MIIIGLTGSIGMGKSTTAEMFAEAGAMVWDADAAVHRLYAVGGAGVAAIAAIAPDAIADGAVDRIALRSAIMADDTILKRVEGVIHPLVGQDRAAALQQAQTNGKRIAVLDIPLIFETGATGAFDAIVVASAPADIQRQRVLARPNMTEAAFEAILAKQVPDAEKRAKADFVVDTGAGLDLARAQVAKIMEWAEAQADATLKGDDHA
jgi:dephospho-CoA kinase